MIPIHLPTFLLVLAVVAGAGFLLTLRRHQRRDQAEAFIRDYRFPQRVSSRVRETYPHLTPEQVGLVLQGVRQYFLLCSQAERRLLVMPSQVVDVAWHEFILFTRDYQRFCQQAFGRFLHHTPAEAMADPTRAQKGLRRIWKLACRREHINPDQPSRLPLLFALDTHLKIADGFHYALDCTTHKRSDVFCASHIGSSRGSCGGGGSCSSCSGDTGSSGGGGGCGGGGD